MQTISKTPALRAAVNTEKAQHNTVALVPTMGNLHEGHLQLVRRAREIADVVVVSIYVNPTQFGANEDLDRYPRTLERDIERLLAEGTDYLFTPSDADVYPNGIERITRVGVEHLSNILCGKSRPGHFDGVCTIVCKLLNLVQPTHALFGEKDLQQLTVIRQMVSDLCMPITIVGVPTSREASGLAMSSRNGFLTDSQRDGAKLIYQILLATQQSIINGNDDFSALCKQAVNTLNDAGFKSDYFEIRQLPDLSLASKNSSAATLAIFAAASLGSTRLIDNVFFNCE
jgi:pantoate--beta-alanine ligase